MSSAYHAPVPRTRPTTKVRSGRPVSPAPIPIPTANPEPPRPKKAHGKKQTSAASDQSRDTRRRSRSPARRHNLQSIGAWSDDIPVRHYTSRFDLDIESRGARNLPAAPMPPSPRRSSRLDTPHPSILAYDAEFRERQTGPDESRVGNAWYISRVAKRDRQLEEALEHMARTGLHPPRE